MSRWERTVVRTCAAFIGKVYCILYASEIGCFLLRQLMSKLVEVLLYVHRNHRLIRDGSPGRPPRLSHSSCALSVCWLKCCFTSTETVGLLLRREPRTTFTQLLSCATLNITYTGLTVHSILGCFPLRQLMPTQRKPLHSNGLLHTLYWQSGVVFCTT